MVPLANQRRLHAIEALVADTRASGAQLQCGGARIGNKGYFFQPTVFSDVPDTARIMSEEPFGPIAPIPSFRRVDEVQQKVNAQIGRASCRERVCQYVYIAVVAVSLKNTQNRCVLL